MTTTIDDLTEALARARAAGTLTFPEAAEDLCDLVDMHLRELDHESTADALVDDALEEVTKFVTMIGPIMATLREWVGVDGWIEMASRYGAISCCSADAIGDLIRVLHGPTCRAAFIEAHEQHVLCGEHVHREF